MGFDISPSTANTIATSHKRLPLGTPTPCPGPGITSWTVWIPSEVGGRLMVLLSGTGKLVLKDLSTKEIASGQIVTYDVPMGTGPRALEVEATLKGDGNLMAYYLQTYWSRQSADLAADPLIPYNFWYWPYKSGGQGDYTARAKAVMTRYAEATGSNPSMAKAAGDWEGKFHSDPNAESWAGHCHNAAPASALFEQPLKSTVGGKDFEEEDLELLATEFFGNFGVKKEYTSEADGWLLRSARMDPPPDRDPNTGAVRRQKSALRYLKPYGPKTRQILLDNMKKDMGEEAATDLVNRAYGKVANTDAQFQVAADEEFGAAAATFFRALLELLAKQGQPLLSNLRSNGPTNGPEEIWNEILFYMFASYRETPGSDDKLDMIIDCTLYSNIDRIDSVTGRSMGSPAKVENGIVVPGSDPTYPALKFNHVYRLVFGADGKPDAANRKNRWYQVMGGTAATPEQLFAPVNLVLIDKPSASAHSRSDDPSKLGNPAVGRELLDTLKLNRRFR